MTPYSQKEIQKLKELDRTLTDELQSMQEEVLKLHCKEKGGNFSIHSLHGTIGGKNNTYVDSIRTQFSDPKEFKAKWLKGFIEYIGENKYSPLRNLMKKKKFRDYTLTFLERNFYRNLFQRTRYKANEKLWAIWFGSSILYWGLIIAPFKTKDSWTYNINELRHAKYMYWTVGHVLTTGLVDPENNELYKFADLDELLKFYRHILKGISNSIYEKKVFGFYVEYLKNSDDPISEPFLIPELRYAGYEAKHKYRLDFTILNSYTLEKIGFELSPHSTHMSVSKIKGKTQKEINEGLSKKWQKEMDKRNKYFADFDITVITFSDEDLKNISDCFDIMKYYLSNRPQTRIDLEEQIELLKNI
ncbi:MAG: hypothetical protein JXL97_03830 [Bacteroidales bacterium]|nr:hypothetical protein [Bacteroidales bacterium]